MELQICMSYILKSKDLYLKKLEDEEEAAVRNRQKSAREGKFNTNRTIKKRIWPSRMRHLIFLTKENVKDGAILLTIDKKEESKSVCG